MGKFISRCFIILPLFISLIYARENPFFPKDGMEDIPYSTNLNKNLPPLKRASMKLPSHAREIQKVTVSYKNLDGSIEEQSIELNNSIDWHLPIFISQSYDTSPNNVVQKTKQPNKKEFIELAKKGYITFSTLGKILKIDTKNELIRDFLLVKPHRIVLDFKKITDSFLKSYSKNNQDGIFKQIKIGNHQGYFRVVIELDGYYTYKYEKTLNGYLFKLN